MLLDSHRPTCTHCPTGPRTPTPSAPSRYPSTGVTYGQSMLCVSLGVTALNSLAAAMKLSRPQFFAKSLSSIVQSKLPDLYGVITSGTYVRGLGVSCVCAVGGGRWLCVGFAPRIVQRPVCPNPPGGPPQPRPPCFQSPPTAAAPSRCGVCWAVVVLPPLPCPVPLALAHW